MLTTDSSWIAPIILGEEYLYFNYELMHQKPTRRVVDRSLPTLNRYLPTYLLSYGVHIQNFNKSVFTSDVPTLSDILT